MKLSIIIPVYNVENYVRQCIESVYRQDLQENTFEVIIVNDGSTDGSMQRINEIICQHSNIKVINQENQGLSVARNKGIENAIGEYILMIDSDDLLIDHSLEPLLNKALDSKADLVIADFTTKTSDEITTIGSNMTQPYPLTFTSKKGKQFFLEDFNPHECYIWHTLYRRMFLLEKHISFVPNITYEDVPFTHECYLKADTCLKAPWLLYIYRTNRPGSATASFSTKDATSYCIVIRELWKLSKMEGINKAHQQKLHEDIYIDYMLLMYGIMRWLKSSKEKHAIIDRLLTEIPDLKFTNGYKQKIEAFFLRSAPHIHFTIREIFWRLKNRKA